MILTNDLKCDFTPFLPLFDTSYFFSSDVLIVLRLICVQMGLIFIRAVFIRFKTGLILGFSKPF